MTSTPENAGNAQMPEDREALFARMKALSMKAGKRQRDLDGMIEDGLYGEHSLFA